MCSIGLGQNARLQFEDYPASETYKGRNAPLLLTKDDLNFKTRRVEAVP